MFSVVFRHQEHFLLILAFAALLSFPAGLNPGPGDAGQHLEHDSDSDACFVQIGVWQHSIRDGMLKYPSLLVNAPTNFAKNKRWWHPHFVIIVPIFSFLCLVSLILFLVAWFWGRILGKAVEASIETFDRKVIGVDVNIGSLNFNPCAGRFVLENMVINNPEGFKSQYLLKVGRVNVDISMKTLLFSRGKTIIINCSEFCDVDVIYEKSLTSSNVDEILHFIEKKFKNADKKEDKQEAKPENAEGQIAATEVILKRVLVEDVGVKAAATFFGGHGVRVAVGDFKYDDFSKEVGNSMVDDIIIILMKSFLKTVATNLVGKTFANMHV